VFRIEVLYKRKHYLQSSTGSSVRIYKHVKKFNVENGFLYLSHASGRRVRINMASVVEWDSIGEDTDV